MKKKQKTKTLIFNFKKGFNKIGCQRSLNVSEVQRFSKYKLFILH